MRSHSLTQLRITGQRAALEFVPDFDFHNLGRVTRVAIEWTAETGDAPELEVMGLYADPRNERTAQVSLRFLGVRQATLPPELFPSVYLSELEIEDISGDQLEGLRYRAKNLAGRASKSCRTTSR